MAEAPPGPGTSADENPTTRTLRDPNAETGEIEEHKAYDKFMSDYYPDFMCNVHRIPDVHLCHPQVLSSRKSQGELKPPEDTVPVYLYGTEDSDVKGDIAEKRVAVDIEYLLKYWCPEKCPAFIITNYKFEQMISSIDLSAEDGEHDALIIHFRYGIFFIQIKSCGSNPEAKIKDAEKQLEKDSEFFKKNFSDLNLNVDITQIVALPNMTKDKLLNEMKEIKKTRDIDRWLLQDNLPDLEREIDSSEKSKQVLLINWWKLVTSNSQGFNSVKDFKIVIERYIGFKSIAHIPHPQMEHLNQFSSDIRRKGHVVSKHGNKVMSIILTPYQLAVLNCSVPRLVIRGQYGTGKTVVLILKARQLLRSFERVCVVSLSQSPLIHLIEASVKHDLASKYSENLEVVSFNSQRIQEFGVYIQEKTDSGQRWNILIDEFPTRNTDDLKEAISKFPEYSLFWVICSRERQRDLNSRLTEIFLHFKQVVFDVMLRCPSSLHNLFPRTETNTEELDILYPGGKLNKPTCHVGPKRKFSTFIHSLSLSTPQTREADPGSEVTWNNVNWSALSVHDKVYSSTKRSFHTQLTTLGVPLVRGSDVINFSIRDEQDVKERRCNRALYTKKVPDDVGDAVLAAVFKDTKLQDTVFKIYLRQNVAGQPPFEIPKSKDTTHLDEYLKRIGFVKDCDHWFDIIFVDEGEVEKPETYAFLLGLGIPLVTPCQRKELFENNTVFITGDFEGYRKRNSIFFLKDNSSTNRITSNMKHQSACEGPRPEYIDHTTAGHTGELKDCKICDGKLKTILDRLGIVKKPESLNSPSSIRRPRQQTLGEQQNVLELGTNPKYDLSFSDLVIIDNKVASAEGEDSPSALDLFKRCDVPVVDKLNHLEPEDAFGSDYEVVYTKPNLFQGLERKVVIVIMEAKPRFRSPLVNGNIVDFIELAISRCSSQLIVLKA